MKYIINLLLLIPLLFLGCSQEIKYVDANTGKEVQLHEPKFEVINPEIVCDTRGFAYYKVRPYLVGSMEHYSLSPVVETSAYSLTRHMKCEDIK